MKRNSLILSSVFAIFAATNLSGQEIVVDIPPTAALVKSITGQNPEVLVSGGASAHDFALSPSQAHSLAKADHIVWIGHAMTPWLETPVRNIANNAMSIELLEVNETKILDARVLESHDHADHDGHDHGPIDPHAWLNTNNAKIWLEHLAKELGEQYPEKREQYASNLKVALDAIDQQQARTESKLQTLGRLEFIIFHDAFQYFEEQFGIHPTATISLSDGSAPSVKQMATLRQRLIDKSIKCALHEPNADLNLLQTVLNGTDVQLVMVDALGSTVDPDKFSYVAIVDQITNALEECSK